MKKLFLQYIYQNRFNIILFIAFSVVFLVVFKLYGLNTEPYFYSLIICLTIGITAAAVNFYRFFREHNQRQHILNNIFINPDTAYLHCKYSIYLTEEVKEHPD